MKILKLLEEWNEKSSFTLGKPLSSKINDEHVVIYRAQPAKYNILSTNCYVTRNKNWAIQHAQHIFATEDQDAHVIRVLVKTWDVYEASNPGEYIYTGPPVKGKSIFIVNANNYIIENLESDQNAIKRLDHNLKIILNLKRQRNNKKLRELENDKGIISRLLKLAIKYKKDGYESDTINLYIGEFNSSTIFAIMNDDVKTL